MNIQTLKNVMSKSKEVNSFFTNKYLSDSWQADVSIYNGRSGTILIQSLILQISKDKKMMKHIFANLNYTIDYINQSSSISPTFSSGVAGWAWVLSYLEEIKLINKSRYNNTKKLVNEFLVENLNVEIHKSNFDPLHGYIGIGLYFLKTKNVEQLKKIILDLKKTIYRIPNTNSSAWSKYDKHYTKQEVFDLGLAHGNAGIIYFLTKAYSMGILTDDCKNMINECSNFYLDNIQLNQASKSYYPYSIKLNSYEDYPLDNYDSRLGWCYGDLTILYSLYNANKLIGNDLRRETFFKLLILVSKRKDLEQTKIEDAGFCHGTSGLAYIYYQLYKETNSHNFRDAFEFWITKSLNYSVEKYGYTGYKFQLGTDIGLIPTTSLLSGLGGVSLAMNQLYAKKHISIKDVFLL